MGAFMSSRDLRDSTGFLHKKPVLSLQNLSAEGLTVLSPIFFCLQHRPYLSGQYMFIEGVSGIVHTEPVA